MNKKRSSTTNPLSHARALSEHALQCARQGNFAEVYHGLRKRRVLYEQQLFDEKLLEQSSAGIEEMRAILHCDMLLRACVENTLEKIRADMARIAAQQSTLRRYMGRRQNLPRCLDKKT